MKTLQNHIILYDDECPMCKAYTKAFIKTGMLEANGRDSYQNMPEEICPVVDRQRAVNEIALVNKITGDVSYGIASLFKIIGNSFPLFKPLFLFKPFIWLLSKLYAFISYNRRVIIPPAIIDRQVIQPTFRLDYRISYLIFTWLITSSILTQYAQLLKPVLPVGTAYREFLICGGQVAFQGIIISFRSFTKRWDYLGNMMTISFAGSLLLFLLLLLAKLIPVPASLAVLYFTAIAGLMLLEHIRRSRILGLGWLLTITWIVYRLIVLLIIIKFN